LEMGLNKEAHLEMTRIQTCILWTFFTAKLWEIMRKYAQKSFWELRLISWGGNNFQKYSFFISNFFPLLQPLRN
jgi:superfamily I DNA and RNA helicase